MPSISFSQKPVTKPAAPAPVVEAEVVESMTEPAVEDNQIVVRQAAPVAEIPAPTRHIPIAEGVEGEIADSDLRPPRINLVQKVGELADNFSPGSIVFEKQVVLSDGKKPLTLVPLRLKKQYQKKVPYGESDVMPEVYDTVEEVRAAGGSTEYGDENYFQPIAHVQFAVEMPEDAGETADLFAYECGGKHYAVAVWTVASSAYTAIAKTLFNAASGLLRNGLYNGKFKVTSELKKANGNSYYVPRMAFSGKNTPEESEFFKTIAGF